MSAWRHRNIIRFDDHRRILVCRHQSRLIDCLRRHVPRGLQVTRLITIMVLAAGLAGCVSSPIRPAQIVQMAPPGGVPARPPSAPQDPAQCIHDEGYGRWTDCGSEK
jgi:hypothetical protein